MIRGFGKSDPVSLDTQVAYNSQLVIRMLALTINIPTKTGPVNPSLPRVLML